MLKLFEGFDNLIKEDQELYAKKLSLSVMRTTLSGV
jgi:hypothetical protein